MDAPDAGAGAGAGIRRGVMINAENSYVMIATQ
jgi:hypothetical protein